MAWNRDSTHRTSTFQRNAGFVLDHRWRAVCIFAAFTACGVSTPSTLAQAGGLDTPDAETLRKATEFTRLIEENLPPVATGANARATPDAFVNAGRGNVPVYLPDTYAPGEPTPLIVLLHGYMNNGDEIDAYFQFSSFVDSYNFILLTPTGRSNFLGMEYWNATDACCDLFGSNPDDSGYLRSLVELTQNLYTIDPQRIHFAGHSNGGFMSYRMACDHADLVASIASLAGATWANPNNCTPSEPVHTLQVHGTSDGVIAYSGGNVPLGGFQPGAVFTAEAWAGYDGCDPAATPGVGPLDLTTDIAGPDANPVEYVTNCDDGGSARLWTIPGGPHSPGLTQDFTTLVLDFLFAHPKPAPCAADLNGDGNLNNTDINAFVSAFLAGDPVADLNSDGNYNNTDINLYVQSFLVGCG